MIKQIERWIFRKLYHRNVYDFQVAVSLTNTDMAMAKDAKGYALRVKHEVVRSLVNGLEKENLIRIDEVYDPDMMATNITANITVIKA